MTREEAIEVLNGILHLNYRNFWDEECDEAIDMAIEALQTDAVRCKDCKNRARYAVCDFLAEDGFCPHGERREP